MTTAELLALPVGASIISDSGKTYRVTRRPYRAFDGSDRVCVRQIRDGREYGAPVKINAETAAHRWTLASDVALSASA